MIIKVICVKSYHNQFILNKIYDGVENENGWIIKNQNAEKSWIGCLYKDSFIPLAEWRENRINSILED